MELISESWDPASISASAAIFGSLVGAMGSAVSAWIAQRHQNQRDLLAKKLFRREQLYSDFISECEGFCRRCPTCISGPEQAHTDVCTAESHSFEFLDECGRKRGTGP